MNVPAKYKEGDNVRLATWNSPSMVVMGVREESGRPTTYSCRWFDKKDRCRELIFKEIELVPDLRG